MHENVGSLKLMSGIFLYYFSTLYSINSELTASIASVPTLASFIASGIALLCLPRLELQLGHHAVGHYVL